MHETHVLVSPGNQLDHSVQHVVAHDAARVLQLPIGQWRIQLVEHHLHQRRIALLAVRLQHLDVVNARREPNDLVAPIAAQLPVGVTLAVQHHHSTTRSSLQVVFLLAGTPTPHSPPQLLRTHAVGEKPVLAGGVKALITSHAGESFKRRVVVAEGTQHEGGAHEALRVAQREEEKIEAVQRTLQLLVQLDRAVWREIVAGRYTTSLFRRDVALAAIQSRWRILHVLHETLANAAARQRFSRLSQQRELRLEQRVHALSLNSV